VVTARHQHDEQENDMDPKGLTRYEISVSTDREDEQLQTFWSSSTLDEIAQEIRCRGVVHGHFATRNGPDDRPALIAAAHIVTVLPVES
jgi:hypothetical protein